MTPMKYRIILGAVLSLGLLASASPAPPREGSVNLLRMAKSEGWVDSETIAHNAQVVSNHLTLIELYADRADPTRFSSTQESIRLIAAEMELIELLFKPQMETLKQVPQVQVWIGNELKLLDQNTEKVRLIEATLNQPSLSPVERKKYFRTIKTLAHQAKDAVAEVVE